MQVLTSPLATMEYYRRKPLQLGVCPNCDKPFFESQGIGSKITYIKGRPVHPFCDAILPSPRKPL